MECKSKPDLADDRPPDYNKRIKENLYWKEGMALKTLTFDDTEIQQVRAIVMDQDGKEALEFLTAVIWERMKEKDSKACGPKPV